MKVARWRPFARLGGKIMATILLFACSLNPTIDASDGFARCRLFAISIHSSSSARSLAFGLEEGEFC